MTRRAVDFGPRAFPPETSPDAGCGARVSPRGDLHSRQQTRLLDTGGGPAARLGLRGGRRIVDGYDATVGKKSLVRSGLFGREFAQGNRFVPVLGHIVYVIPVRDLDIRLIRERIDDLVEHQSDENNEKSDDDETSSGCEGRHGKGGSVRKVVALRRPPHECVSAEGGSSIRGSVMPRCF